MRVTRVNYLELYKDGVPVQASSRNSNRHTSLIECVEHAHEHAREVGVPGDYEVRVDGGLYYMIRVVDITLDASLDPENPPEPQAEFAIGDASYSVVEGQTVDITITRSVRTDQVCDIDWAVTNASVTPLSGTERFQIGDTQRTIQLTAQQVDTSEDGNLTISNPQLISGPVSNPILGSPSTVDFDVLDTADRPDGAGLYITFHSPTEPALSLAPVMGGFPRNEVTNMVPNGDYTDTANYSHSGISNRWAELDRLNKRGQMAVSGRKDADWQQHFWYATNASAQGASKRENPAPPNDWIGAYWDQDTGNAAVEAIYDLALWYWDNIMTASQRNRTIGIRISQNAIATEGRDPGNTLDDTALYVRGSNAGVTRPEDHTSALENQVMSAYQIRMLDRAFPVSDSDPPLYPLLFRPNVLDDSAALQTRADALIAADQIGYVITSLEPEPRNSGHESNSSVIRAACAVEGGNSRTLTEPFGDLVDDSDIDAQWSNLQHIYWGHLQSLAIGTTYIMDRARHVAEYDGGAATEAEWIATYDFLNKYAGYQQFPSQSPGCWIAFREGSRLTGNYEFMLRQIVNGTTAIQGTELFAGADGGAWSSHPGGGDYVGLPSDKSDQSSDAGTGQRQSIWLRQWNAGENCKLEIPVAALRTALDGQTLTIRVHVLDNASATSIAVNVFNSLVGTINVGNTANWIEHEFSIPSASIAVDVDNAHIVLTPSGGQMRLHMVELSTS